MQKRKLALAGATVGIVAGIAIGMGLIAAQGTPADDIREIPLFAKVNDEQAGRLADSYCTMIESPSGAHVDPDMLADALSGMDQGGMTDKDAARTILLSVDWKCPDLSQDDELVPLRRAVESDS